MTTYTEQELELIKLKAIQDYLLTRGHNDEKINDKIRKIENPRQNFPKSTS